MPTNIPSLADMIRQLVAIPSMSSVNPAFDTGNRAVIERLADWLEALGFAIEIMPIPGHLDKANLVATLGHGPGGLVLSGHTDTVPYDEGRWHADPFRLHEQGNRYYGLGTADMKSFLALAIEAARELEPAKLKEPLIILATADEESTMDGARLLVEQSRPRARYAVIGEPTDMKPIRMHKGIMMEAIRVTGQSGHSSDPALGNNALEGMHRVMGAVLDWRQALQAKYRNPHFAVPVPTLNLGHIHGGDNPNRICAECELHIDLRPLPGMPLDALRESLHEHLAETLADSALSLDIRPLFDGIPAFETAADSKLVACTEKLTGYSAGAVAFGTEGPFLNQLGMDTIIMGPGSIDQAHQPDEYLSLAHITPTVDILKQLIKRFCLQER